MKRLVLVTLLIVPMFAMGQNKENKTDSMQIKTLEIEEIEERDEIFYIVEKMPEFPGGKEALKKHIASNIKYPKTTTQIDAKVYIRFCIDVTGEITKVTIARSINPVLDKEALRLIKTLPKWKPGEQRGKKVKVWYTMPVHFKH